MSLLPDARSGCVECRCLPFEWYRARSSPPAPNRLAYGLRHRRHAPPARPLHRLMSARRRLQQYHHINARLRLTCGAGPVEKMRKCKPFVRLTSVVQEGDYRSANCPGLR